MCCNMIAIGAPASASVPSRNDSTHEFGWNTVSSITVFLQEMTKQRQREGMRLAPVHSEHIKEQGFEATCVCPQNLHSSPAHHTASGVGTERAGLAHAACRPGSAEKWGAVLPSSLCGEDSLSVCS